MEAGARFVWREVGDLLCRLRLKQTKTEKHGLGFGKGEVEPLEVGKISNNNIIHSFNVDVMVSRGIAGRTSSYHGTHIIIYVFYHTGLDKREYINKEKKR